MLKRWAAAFLLAAGVAVFLLRDPLLWRRHPEVRVTVEVLQEDPWFGVLRGRPVAVVGIFSDRPGGPYLESEYTSASIQMAGVFDDFCNEYFNDKKVYINATFRGPMIDADRGQNILEAHRIRLVDPVSGRLIEERCDLGGGSMKTINREMSAINGDTQ
tara:strand:+ start:476 stop:952 length:477 start_codon:yes stop_codon:yes gene_type:complete